MIDGGKYKITHASIDDPGALFREYCTRLGGTFTLAAFDECRRDVLQTRDRVGADRFAASDKLEEGL